MDSMVEDTPASVHLRSQRDAIVSGDVMSCSGRTRRSTLLRLGGIALVVFGAGCQTPQRSISLEELIARKPDLLRAVQAEIERVDTTSERRIDAEYHADRSVPGAPRQSYDVLVLSGGGAFGSFGAGFLDGWGSVTDSEFARPHFDQVTGISTGALIAPYAFIGSPAAYRSLVTSYQNPGSNWVRQRGLIPLLPGNVSLYDVSELRRHIRSSVTPELVAGLSKGSGEDRVLMVGATSLDYALLRVWDVARIARTSPIEQAIEEIAAILSASSAIPGVFPPVEIDDLLYVDGGATMQVVGGLDDRSWLYVPDDQSLEVEFEGPPVRVRVWMIVNQKLRPQPEVVRSRWTSISARSLAVLVRTSMLQSIRDGEAYAALLDARPELDVVLRYVAIPQDFEIPDTDRMFDSRSMRALVELGRRMGADPGSWRTGALRPGVPFQID
jgi:hypothetical protein